MSKNNSNTQGLTEGFAQHSYEDWLAEATRSLKGRNIADLQHATADGINIEVIYAAADASAIAGMPCSAPKIISAVAEVDPAAANAALLAELEGGADGIALQFGTHGQPGLPVSGAAIETAIADVLLDAASLSLDLGSGDWPQALEAIRPLVQRVAEKSGHLNINADPIGLVVGSQAQDPADAIGAKLGTDLSTLAEFASQLKDRPGINLFSASGIPAHEAGATEAQELAAMLVSGTAYLRALDGAGHAPAKAMGWIALEMAADTEIFVNIAKLRAARALWARVAELCGTTARPSLHVRSSARMMAKADVHTNMLRTTTAALAAGLGGADSLTVLPFTHGLGKPDNLGRRVARNTMNILGQESFVGAVSDPALGSGLVESLTESLAEAAWKLFQAVEAAGGGTAPGSARLLTDAITTNRDARDADLKSGARIAVGVNAFVNDADIPPQVEPWPQ